MLFFTGFTQKTWWVLGYYPGYLNPDLVTNNLNVTVYRAADELKNEAMAHKLKHENIVTLYAMVFEPQHYGVVLEFVLRGCLEQFIYQYKVLYDVISYLVTLASGNVFWHLASCCVVR